MQGLDILNLHQQDIAGLGAFDIERTGEVMDASEVNVTDIVGRVVVLDLSASPIDAFNFDRLSVFDTVARWNYRICQRESRVFLGKHMLSGCHRLCKYGNVAGSSSRSTLTAVLKAVLPMVDIKLPDSPVLSVDRPVALGSCLL